MNYIWTNGLCHVGDGCLPTNTGEGADGRLRRGNKIGNPPLTCWVWTPVFISLFILTSVCLYHCSSSRQCVYITLLMRGRSLGSSLNCMPLNRVISSLFHWSNHKALTWHSPFKSRWNDMTQDMQTYAAINLSCLYHFLFLGNSWFVITSVQGYLSGDGQRSLIFPITSKWNHRLK